MMTLDDLAAALARVVQELAEHHAEKGAAWRHESIRCHVNHADTHLVLATLESHADRRLEHLAHAAVRSLFALQLHLEQHAKEEESA